jgi:hypothetical protein
MRKFNYHTPLLHHITGSLIVQLVRLTSIPEASEEAQKMLQDVVGDQKTQLDMERPSLVEGYDVITNKFLDIGQRRQVDIHQMRRESDSHHYNDSNGIGRLAHLAELAVGEGTEREYASRVGMSDALRNIGGEEGLDNLVRRQGYLYALQILLQS